MLAAISLCGCPATEKCQCIAALKQATKDFWPARCQDNLRRARVTCQAALQAAEYNKPQNIQIDSKFLQGGMYRSYLTNLLRMMRQIGADHQDSSDIIDIEAWKNLAKALRVYRKEAQDQAKFIVATEISGNQHVIKVKQAVISLADDIEQLFQGVDHPLYLQHVDINLPAAHARPEQASFTSSTRSFYLMTACSECDGWTERSLSDETELVDAVLKDWSILISASDRMRLRHRPSLLTAPLTYVQVKIQPGLAGADSDLSIRGLARRDRGTWLSVHSTGRFKQLFRPGDRESALMTEFAKTCDDASDSLTGAAKGYDEGSSEGSQLSRRATALSFIADICRQPPSEQAEDSEEG